MYYLPALNVVLAPGNMLLTTTDYPAVIFQHLFNCTTLQGTYEVQIEEKIKIWYCLFQRDATCPLAAIPCKRWSGPVDIVNRAITHFTTRREDSCNEGTYNMTKDELKLVRSSASSTPEAPLLSAKVQIPKNGGRVFPRKRLLRLVADFLKQGHLWIHGPPGSGKTVLAANYGDQISIPVAWYELDPLDADIVSFFSTFPQAFSCCRPGRTSIGELPRLQPEDMLALPVFSRKFFRKLFSFFPEKWTLILDNFQEIPEKSPLVPLLVICLQELPVHCRAIILSRKPSPACFARLRIEGHVQEMNPEVLRFTPAEISEVMTLHGITGEQENCIRYLEKTTAGWAAGLTLLLREQNRKVCDRNPGNELDRQELFDYFAGVIFTGLDKEEKNRLMLASLLPEIQPELLNRLQPDEAGGEYFLRLSRENFFTYKLDNQGKLFQFHPLFKEFLRRKAHDNMPAATRTRLLEKAADYLLAENRFSEAIELLIQAESWPRTLDLIRQTGKIMLDQGRFKTLLRWRQALPREIVQADPWLLFFFGVATTAFDPLQAIEILKSSFSLFQRQSNNTGAILACCSLTNSIINHLSELPALDPWLDFLEEQLDPRTFLNDGSFENDSIASAVARAFVLRRPAHPDLELWLAHVVDRGGMHPALITHYLWTGRFPEARAALDNIYAHIDQVGSKLLLSAIKAMEVQYYLIMCDADKCIRVIEESRNMMKKTGIRVWEVHFFILGAGCLLNCGRRKEAAGYLQLMEENIGRARLLERSYYHVVKTLEALLDEDLPAADRHQCSALDMAEKIGMPSYSIWCWYGSALVAVFQGDYEEARSRFSRVFELAEAPGNPWFTCQAHLGLAFMYFENGARKQAVRHLGHGFSLARKRNYLSFFFFVPRMMETLVIAALEENIEAEVVCRFIRRWQLTPKNPPLHLDNWPWPVKIFTLGRFTIIRHEKKLSATAHAKNKPVQLLQAIIALGGRQVSKTRLADIFWPDSNGDEQAAALKTTLHRLRRLLDVRNVIIQTPNTLSLNGGLCWVDSWQFERLAGLVLKNNNITEEERKNTIAQTSARYRGEFLPFLEDEPWSFAYRRHLDDLNDQLVANAMDISPK